MDKALKQRLVGASVLVALAVVVLPMLLGGGPDAPPDSRPIDLPPKPRELAFDTRRFPVGDQAPDQPSVLPAPADAAVTAPSGTAAGETPSQESVPPAENPAEPPPTGGEDGSGNTAQDAPPELAGSDAAPADTPSMTGPEAAVAEPAGPMPAETAGGRYLVQVASFSSTANTERLAGQLRASGLPVLLDQVDTNAGSLHRVRIGPYATAADAESALEQVRAVNSDINPRVMDLQPDEAAPVSEPSDPLVRWVVQVGSFGEPGNAEALVFRLRDAGFAASSQKVTDASGEAWKVRVGPMVERQEALRTAQRLQAEQGLAGLVMSAE